MPPLSSRITLSEFFSLLSSGLLASLVSFSQASISCPMTTDFCGWTASPENAWSFVPQTNGVRPPSGGIHYAAAISSVAGFAELESPATTLTEQTTLTFSYAQMAFSSSAPVMQLWLLSGDGTSEQIWTAHSSLSWKAQTVSLASRANFKVSAIILGISLFWDAILGSQLRFRLYVGNIRNIASVVNVVIVNENEVVAPAIPLSTAPTTATSTTPQITSTATPGPTSTSTPISTTTTAFKSTNPSKPSDASDRFLSCTFQAGMCGWNNDASNAASWRIVQGIVHLGLGYPGPQTSADEFYLYMHGDTSYDRSAAKLVSPPFTYTGRSEIRFWCRFGHYYSTSKLGLVVNNQNYASSYVLAVNSDQSGAWREAEAVFNTTGTVQVFFLAEVENGDTVALDEIRWTGDMTSLPPTLGTAPDNSTQEVATSYQQNSTTSTAEPSHSTTPSSLSSTQSATTTNATFPATTQTTTALDLTPTEIPFWATVQPPCLTESALVVSCAGGSLNFSEPDIDASDALVAHLDGDNTLKCRHILRDMQQWLLSKKPAHSDGPSPHAAETFNAQCTRGQGLVVSSETDPELSEFTKILYRTAVHNACRSTFLSFLKKLKAYSLA